MSNHTIGWSIATLATLMIAGMGNLHLSNNQLNVSNTKLHESNNELHVRLSETNKRLETLQGNIDEILALSRRMDDEGMKADRPSAEDDRAEVGAGLSGNGAAVGASSEATRRNGRGILSSDDSVFRKTSVSAMQVETPSLCAATVETWALSVNGTNLVNYLNSNFDTVIRMLTLLVGSISKTPTMSPTPLPTSQPTKQPTPLPSKQPTSQPTVLLPGRDSSKPATSGGVILAQGDPSGFYWIQPTSSSANYRMYVDNDRNGGGWVLTARVTVADCQAHWSNGAVNFDGTNGPTATRSSTVKVADSWMNALRSASSYSGTTAYWMESTGTWGSSGAGSRSTFVHTCASVDLVPSASDQNCRTILSTTFEGSMSDENPNTGTRGFGNHHATGGTYFAYQRHPEEGNNCGFSSDALGYGPGGSDGNLWIK